MKVVQLDLLAMVPYYTGHLSAALADVEGIDVSTAAVDYRHDPEFFARTGVRRFPGLVDAASRARRLPDGLRRGLRGVEYLLNMAIVLAHFLRSRPDVVHVQFLPLSEHGLPFELWFLQMLRALRIRIVYTVHNVLPQDGGQRCRRIFRRIYGVAHGLICHDKGAAQRLISEFGVPAGRIAIVPHGVLFGPAAQVAPPESHAACGSLPGQTVFLWQGILRPYKGVSFLLRAWRRVCDQDPSARLVIAGTGEPHEMEAVRREVSAFAISRRVQLELRFLPLDELSALLGAADVLVYPYREITTSGALMTGVAHGKAIVASRLPAFEQILLHGKNALLVPYGDVEGLASAFLRLIREPAYRAALAAAIREADPSLPRWPAIARRTCEFYKAIQTNRSCPTGKESFA
jgi:glycosyltransferase involved in cell wall biosynthesis